jgi:hypothetical protein
MSTRRTIVSMLLAAAVSLSACGRSKPPAAVGTSVAVKSGASTAQDAEDLNKQIVSALQQGRYTDAAVLARRAKVSKAESDFAVGEIILQGHADARAAQVPRETIEEGLDLIEAAALAGHQQAISGLAATFHTGLHRKTDDAFLLEPDAGLSQCWDTTKAMPQKARSCVDMRKKR